MSRALVCSPAQERRYVCSPAQERSARAQQRERERERVHLHTRARTRACTRTSHTLSAALSPTQPAARAGPPARVDSGPPIPARRFRPVDSGQPAAAGRHYISRLKRRRIVAATWGLAVANGVRSGAATVRRERALIPRPMDFEPGSGCRRVLCAMLPPPARSPLSLREEKGPGPVLRDVGPRGLVLCVHAISAVHDARSWSSCR